MAGPRLPECFRRELVGLFGFWVGSLCAKCIVAQGLHFEQGLKNLNILLKTKNNDNQRSRILGNIIMESFVL